MVSISADPYTGKLYFFPYDSSGSLLSWRIVLNLSICVCSEVSIEFNGNYFQVSVYQVAAQFCLILHSRLPTWSGLCCNLLDWTYFCPAHIVCTLDPCCAQCAVGQKWVLSCRLSLQDNNAHHLSKCSKLRSHSRNNNRLWLITRWRSLEPFNVQLWCVLFCTNPLLFSFVCTNPLNVAIRTKMIVHQQCTMCLGFHWR